jgi:DNA-binding transcriptional LysR family regulator
MRLCIPYIVSMDWRDLQTFLATAEAGSTLGASEALGLDQSTVSRRVTAFEKAIGQRLFERLPSGLVMTPAGERMLATARGVDSDIHALERQMIGEDPALHGDIRLTVPPLMLDAFVAPILQDFHRRHPEVHLEIDVSMAEMNLTKREADIAIRGSNTPPEHLIGRCAGRYHLAVYGHRDLAGKPEDLPWIGWGEPGELDAWITEHGLPPAKEVVWRVDGMEGQIAMVKAGLGITAIPCPLADAEPDLVRVYPDKSWPNRDIWVLTHKDLMPSPRIRTLFNFLADELHSRRVVLEGNGG